MIFLPLLMGIVVATVLAYGVSVLRKKGFSLNTIHTYTLSLLAVGILIVLYGYFSVRGFEGFAYLLLGTPIILVSFITFAINIKDNIKFGAVNNINKNLQ